MKAIQLDGPGPPEALHIRELPLPIPPPGWVRIRVAAFGLNRSELHLRLGFATNASFPRVPGIECAGTIDDAGGTPLRRGQKVVAMMARQTGATVIATTRQRARLSALAEHGVDHPLLDDESIADAVRALSPDGADAVLELVGASTLRDSLRATRLHGTVCFTGMVSNEWMIRDFYPIDFIPSGVRLTAYSGEAAD